MTNSRLCCSLISTAKLMVRASLLAFSLAIVTSFHIPAAYAEQRIAQAQEGEAPASSKVPSVSPPVSGSTSPAIESDACSKQIPGPNFPSELKGVGLPFNTTAVYAWFTIIVPTLMDWPAVDNGEANRKYFTPNGWIGYNKYVEDSNIHKFLSDHKNYAVIISFLNSAPKFNWDHHDDVHTAVFWATIHSTYAVQGNPAKLTEKLYKLTAYAIRNSADGTFLINQWDVEELPADNK